MNYELKFHRDLILRSFLSKEVLKEQKNYEYFIILWT